MYKIIYVNIIEKKYMTVLFMTSSYKTKKVTIYDLIKILTKQRENFNFFPLTKFLR